MRIFHPVQASSGKIRILINDARDYPSMARAEIEDIDNFRRVIDFQLTYRPKKITGSRIAAIVGQNEYASEFKVACDIIGLYSEPSNKYTDAGNAIEPKIRQYLRENRDRYIGTSLGNGKLDVLDPIPAKECNFEHFPQAAPFGGMVDGWVDIDGKHAAVLEIKTAGRRDDWFDGNGGEIAPPNYILQTSLYCDLSGLDEIVFAVGFLEESDYDHPDKWEPNDGNFIVRTVKPVPMGEYKKQALEWYNRYIMRGVTPQWNDCDKAVLDQILEKRH